MANDKFFDVIIIGAGAAGLMAARELCLSGKKVAIIEGRDRIGGRVHTINDEQFFVPAELGAEFIHGNLKLTLDLLKKAKITYHKVKGELWQYENGKLKEQDDFIEDYSGLEKKLKELNKDISVAAFIKNYLKEDRFKEVRRSLKSYIEGYWAADTNKASTYALRDELMNTGEGQYRVDGGYQNLLQFLNNECTQRGGSVFLSSKVSQINWQENNVSAVANGQEFRAQKTIITVPLGILQVNEDSKSYIRFSPGIQDKLDAAKKLGFGPAIKLLLQFNNAFWKEAGAKKLSFVFSEEEVPTWWTQYPQNVPMITAWLAGPKAEKLKSINETALLQKALASLGNIFNRDIAQLQSQLKGFYMANWGADVFSCGAYAYETVNGGLYRKIVKTPVEKTLFFAGEALYEGIEIGTVEAALNSGKEVAEKVIISLGA